MKIILTSSLVFFISMFVFGQSPYEVPIVIPPYDATNPAMQLITTTNNGWSQINNLSKKYFYVQPGDYYSSIGLINLTASGTSGSERYISLYNGNDTHPGKLATNQLANVVFNITGDYWIIDRMALFTTNTAPMRLENANNNVINRFYALNAGDIGFRHGCDANTIQNCRMEILDRTIFPDRPAFGMINYSSSTGGMISNAQITNTHIVNNETYNYVDGFQSVLHDYNATGNVTGVNYEGTIVDYNHFYVDDLMYTDCNGNYNVNGICAYSENGVDLKCGSENVNNPMIISNNKMWGYKKSDETNSDLSDWGTAIAVHFGVNNVEINNNVFFNSDRGITMAGVYPNMGTNPQYPMLNSKFKNNILYNIKEFGFYQGGTKDIVMEDNLFKNVCHSGFWTWGISDDTPSGLACSNFTFRNNMVANAIGNPQGNANPAITGSTTYLGNQYFNARPGSYSHSSDVIHSTDPTANYCDLVFTTDNYTNNPWTITIPKVLSPSQCVPCTPTSALLLDTACSSYTWTVNAQTYTASGTYVVTSMMNGCSHTDSLQLIINNCPQPTGIYLEAECADAVGSFWTEVNDGNASNSKYLLAQSAFYNTTSGLGAGTVAQLVLTYNITVPTTAAYYLNARVISQDGGANSVWYRINGGTWVYWNMAISTSYIWDQFVSSITLPAGANTLEVSLREGDLILDKLALTGSNVLPTGMGGAANNCNNCSPTSSSQTTSACQSYTWSTNGQTYTTSGTYTDVSTNGNGCVHTDSLVLTISNTTSSSQVVSACQSYVWSINGQTYTTSGTYTDVSTNGNGCIHTDSLVLTISNTTSSSQVVSACQSYVWSINGQTYTTSGTYTDVTTNGNGCVHTDSLVLTISNTTSSSQTVSACQSYVWNINGQTYTTSGVYTDVSTNGNGCVHTDSLVLTINNTTSSNQTVSACQSYMWNVSGQTYTTSGIYTNVTTSGSGCTHTDSLILTITTSTSSNQMESACQSYTWSVNGQTYTASGTYTDVSTNGNGCTHTDSLVLTVATNSSSTQSVTACNEYTWPINSVTYTNSGTYVNTINIGTGCTQIDTLILALGLVDNTVTATATVLASNNQFGAVYQWMDCITGALIAGATDRTFVPLVDGTYAVIVTDAGCTDTSSCYSVYGVGVKEHESNVSNIYPNPSTNEVTIDLSTTKQATVEIYNHIGKLVLRSELKEVKSKLGIESFASGVYVFRVFNESFDEKIRVIKQ